MYTTSIRVLRADLATAVRRAEAGESTVVTVHGRPVASLGTDHTGAPLRRGDPRPVARQWGGATRPTPGRVASGRSGQRLDRDADRPGPARDPRMTLFLDTSAVLAAVVDGRDRTLVVDAIADHPEDVFASALGLTEALAAIDRLIDSEILRADLEDAVRRLWDHLHIVPVDQRCLDDAARLARERPIRLADADPSRRRAPAPGAGDVRHRRSGSRSARRHRRRRARSWRRDTVPPGTAQTGSMTGTPSHHAALGRRERRGAQGRRRPVRQQRVRRALPPYRRRRPDRRRQRTRTAARALPSDSACGG